MEEHLRQALARMDERALIALMQRRPDVLELQPRTLDELVEALVAPRALVAALRTSPLPHLHVVEAALALGGRPRIADLGRLLDDANAKGDHAADVRRVVNELTELTVAVFDDDRMLLPATAPELFEAPLGLGRPMAALLENTTVRDLEQLLSAHGLDRTGRRQVLLDRVLARFADTAALAAILATAPPGVADAIAQGLPELEGYDAELYTRRRSTVAWAVRSGLVIDQRYGYQVEVPAEVVLAARGPGYRAPFVPRPPVVGPAEPVSPRRLHDGAAAAASAFSGQLLTVLDRLARTPVPALRTGGIGTRELTKLAKACGADEFEVRVDLELADELGLLEGGYETFEVSDAFPAWRDLEPGQQLASALRAWWELGQSPGETRDADGKAVRALRRRGPCDGCRAARTELLATAAATGPLGADDLARTSLWRRPLVHVLAQDAQSPLATVIREAELLGVLVAGAVTELGRALLDNDVELLVDTARALLPAATANATFGSDLTAYVAGTPTSAVSALLDSAADRESRGGAITWRFTPGSVRRALDDGATGESLLAALTSIADAGLPQPLRYLVSDVARQHGILRLSEATSLIRSDDTALLKIVAADRALAKLGIRLVAPTVLAADVPVAALLAALRAAGYYPALEADTTLAAPEPSERATGRVEQTELRRAIDEWGRRMEIEAPAMLSPEHLAATLVATKPKRPKSSAPSAAAQTASVTERILAPIAAALSPAEVRLLARAVERGSRVRIEYVATNRKRTSRVIEGPEIEGNSLYAWCELRQDDRVFTIARIVGVSRA